MIGRRSALLLAALWAGSTARAEAPLSEDEQLVILDEIGAALAGERAAQSVERHFRKDAVFAGAEDYPWDLAGFRKLLVSRDCSTKPSSSKKAEIILIAYSATEKEALKAHPGYGPGLFFHCISPRRLATHEGYMFRFEGRKISRVTLAAQIAVPAPDARPAKGSVDRD